MTHIEKLTQQIAQLKQAVKQKDKAISSLETKLQTSKDKNRLLTDELKKK